MIIIEMHNIKSKIIGLNTLPFTVLNEICSRCSYVKKGYGLPNVPKYLINPNIGILYTGLLSYVVAIFHKYNIEYTIQDMREKPNKKYNFRIVNGFVPRDYQQRLISTAISKKRCIIQAATGAGKAVTLDTPILTPNGFKLMRDIHLNDIVFDENGKKTKVIGEYFQGLKDVYEVSFQDGSKIQCCEDHLWKLALYSKKFNLNECEVKPLKDILNNITYIRNIYKYAVPVNKPIEFDKKELTIPPYLLGLLLGAGIFTQNQILFTNSENDLVLRLKESSNQFGMWVLYKKHDTQYIFKTFQNKNIFSDYISKTFNYCNSINKFIPKEYLFSSIEDRFELIRGLIDANGYINSKSHIIFRTISKQLFNNMQFLIRSLGYRTTYNIDRHHDSIVYKLYIWNNDNKLFSSDKHKKNFQNRNIDKNRRYDILKIIDIKKLPKQQEMKCIAVDSPEHTYICENFIVTHNTFIMANIIKTFGVNTLVVAPKASLSVQIRNEFQEFFGIKIGLINGTTIDVSNNDKYYPIIIGTPQTLINHPEILNWAEAVMCDEGHNIPARTIFDLLSQTRNAYYRVGVSATPWRDDGCDLLIDALFAPRKSSDTVTASELIDKNVLTPVNINFIKCPSNCEWQGDYASTYDKAIIDNEYRNNVIVEKAKLHYLKNEPTVILISKMKHGLKLLSILQKCIDNKTYNISYKDQLYTVHTIEFLSGKDDIDTREAVFQAIREGKTKICIGSTILDEGIDIKPLQCLIMAQGGCSSTRLFQRVGRVLRTVPGKKVATVYDFWDSNPTLNNHSQIRLNLMKMEPNWNIKFI